MLGKVKAKAGALVRFQRTLNRFTIFSGLHSAFEGLIDTLESLIQALKVDDKQVPIGRQ